MKICKKMVRPPRHQLCTGRPMLYKVGIDRVAGVVGAVGCSFKCTFLYLVSHGILKNSHGKDMKLHFRISLGILVKPSSLTKYQLGKFDIIIILMEYRISWVIRITFKGWCDLCSGATFLWFSTRPRTAEKNLEWPLPSVT